VDASSWFANADCDHIAIENPETKNNTNMRNKYKLIYKNFFGEYNIIVTETTDGKHPSRYVIIPEIEIYKAHVWINDNVVCKNHTDGEIFQLNDFIGNIELRNLFGFDVSASKLILNKNTYEDRNLG